MRKLLMIAGVACALSPVMAHAQVKIDMTKVTCSQVLGMSPEDQVDFGAWMAGWYAQKSGRTFIDMGLFQKNFESVKSWCASNPSEQVMAGLQRAFDQK